MTGPSIDPAFADAVGHLLAFVLGWAALFFVGPIACVALLVLQAAGVATPPGAAWIHVLTAGAWLLALGGWGLLRLLARGARRIEAFASAVVAPLSRPKRRRVVILDAATGLPLQGQPPVDLPQGPKAGPRWEWGARREQEFAEWSAAGARLRSMLRDREATAGSAPPPPPRPQGRPAAASSTPPGGAASAREARASGGSAAPPRDRRASSSTNDRGRPHASPPPPPPPPRAAPAPGPDPWSVLGLRRGATQDAIRQAYRDLIKQYHPDRVAGMPREFQAIAHDKTREIREAYEVLRAGPRSR